PWLSHTCFHTRARAPAPTSVPAERPTGDRSLRRAVEARPHHDPDAPKPRTPSPLPETRNGYARHGRAAQAGKQQVRRIRSDATPAANNSPGPEQRSPVQAPPLAPETTGRHHHAKAYRLR